MTNEERIDRMKHLSETLMLASRAYYRDGKEIMTNFEYDKLYDELLKLEEETGIVLSGSPTQRVGYEVADELPKQRHDTPMLSLDKTKEPADLLSFLGDERALISWKLDGLTVVLTYEDGKLFSAVTRGNGEVGEVITANAKTFINLPLQIPFKGRLILRGEAVIGYRDFAKTNEAYADAGASYKNPRNLCSGSVRQKDSAVTAKRRVQFYAFALVEAKEADFHNSRKAQFDFLAAQGFDVVEHFLVDKESLLERMAYFAEKIKTQDIPSDGLVLTYEDLSYSASLGRTAKFPRDSYAFKWQDETAETVLREIEWSPSRTGLINPVAVFDPVELEGTTVSRASLHNVSVLEGLEIGIGDHLLVYKANMIIPQIAENLTRSGRLPLPKACPACDGKTRLMESNGTKTLICENADCPVKKTQAFVLFAGRDALDIAGLSEATIEKFTAHKILTEYRDFFHLQDHADAICAMEGFGEKSCENLIQSAEKARNAAPEKLLTALGIAGVGLSTATVLMRHFGSFKALREADTEALSAVPGVGSVVAASIRSYFEDPKKTAALDRLLPELHLTEVETAGEALLGKSFVITGSLYTFKSRNEAKEAIEKKGGRVLGSVSTKTSYLVNNDNTSTSAKNKKAKALGIPVITEEELLTMLAL